MQPVESDESERVQKSTDVAAAANPTELSLALPANASSASSLLLAVAQLVPVYALEFLK